jgi:hypothetical protein
LGGQSINRQLSSRPSANDVLDAGSVNGRLRVVVLRASRLHTINPLVQMNPFVRVVLVGPSGSQGAAGTTTPVLGGDRNPQWQGSGGVLMLRYATPPDAVATSGAWHLSVTVLHRGATRRDAVLAVGFVDVSAWVARKAPREALLCPLRSESGKGDRGLLSLTVEGFLGLITEVDLEQRRQRRQANLTRLQPEEETPLSESSESDAEALPQTHDGDAPLVYHCRFDVAVLCGTDLRGGSSTLTMSPFVRVSVMAADGTKGAEATTAPVTRGGDNPRFAQNNVCALTYSCTRGAKLKLLCEVWEALPVGGDVLLSLGKADVSDLACRRRPAVVLTVPLHDESRLYRRGSVTVSVRSSVLRIGDGPREPAHRYTKVELIGTPPPVLTRADITPQRPRDRPFVDSLHVRRTPVVVAGPWTAYGHRVVAVAAGSHHSMVISGPETPSSSAVAKASHRLWAWGLNDCGQLGLGHLDNRLSPTQVPFSHTADGSVLCIRDVALGSSHSIALTGTEWQCKPRRYA